MSGPQGAGIVASFSAAAVSLNPVIGIVIGALHGHHLGAKEERPQELGARG
jgi:hypothetical protein